MKRPTWAYLIGAGAGIALISIFPIKSEPVPHGFTMNFGGCAIAPPSPAAALAILEGFYGFGQGSGAVASDYDQTIVAQYEAAGWSKEKAELQMAHINQCAARWRP